MSQGDKDKYTAKQKREAHHIEEGYEERGVSEKEAARRAWATVNKMHGGGGKGGSGTAKIKDPSPASNKQRNALHLLKKQQKPEKSMNHKILFDINLTSSMGMHRVNVLI
jgi:hypothetical protein